MWTIEHEGAGQGDRPVSASGAGGCLQLMEGGVGAGQAGRRNARTTKRRQHGGRAAFGSIEAAKEARWRVWGYFYGLQEEMSKCGWYGWAQSGKT
jgi:hypothetical protein